MPWLHDTRLLRSLIKRCCEGEYRTFPSGTYFSRPGNSPSLFVWYRTSPYYRHHAPICIRRSTATEN